MVYMYLFFHKRGQKKLNSQDRQWAKEQVRCLLDSSLARWSSRRVAHHPSRPLQRTKLICQKPVARTQHAHIYIGRDTYKYIKRSSDRWQKWFRKLTLTQFQVGKEDRPKSPGDYWWSTLKQQRLQQARNRGSYATTLYWGCCLKIFGQAVAVASAVLLTRGAFFYSPTTGPDCTNGSNGLLLPLSIELSDYLLI